MTMLSTKGSGGGGSGASSGGGYSSGTDTRQAVDQSMGGGESGTDDLPF